MKSQHIHLGSLLSAVVVVAGCKADGDEPAPLPPLHEVGATVLTYRLTPAEDGSAEPTAAEVGKVIGAMQQRLAGARIAAPLPVPRGEHRVEVTLPGISPDNAAPLKQLLGHRGLLGLRMVDTDADPWNGLAPRVEEYRRAHPDDAEGLRIEVREVFDRPAPQLEAADRSTLKAFLAWEEARRRGAGEAPLIDAEHVVGFQEIEQYQPRRRGRQVFWRALCAHREAQVTGANVEAARAEDPHPSSGAEAPFVSVELDEAGAIAFERLTAANVRRYLAIMIDDEVNSAPLIKERIPGGRIRLTLGSIGRSFQQLQQEAQDLARLLRGGAYPHPVELVSERYIGPAKGTP